MNGELGGPVSVITVTVNNVRMLSEFKGHLNIILRSLSPFSEGSLTKDVLIDVCAISSLLSQVHVKPIITFYISLIK
jgi:hypothetical protein